MPVRPPTCGAGSAAAWRVLGKELVELHALPRRMAARRERLADDLRRRLVQEQHGIAEAQQIPCPEHGVGQGVLEREVGERAADESPQLVLAQAGRGRVDRRQRLGHGRVFSERPDNGDAPSRPEKALPDLAYARIRVPGASCFC